MERFVEQLLVRQDWQTALGAEIEDGKFASLAVEMAATQQIALDPKSVLAELLEKRSPIIVQDWPTSGWTPAKVVMRGPHKSPMIDWIWVGQEPLNTPFYEDSLRKFRSRPINRFVRISTSAETLIETIIPAGFVYHMSRCGSTLVGRMLASDRQNLVLSEPSPLDEVINLASQPHVGADDAIRMIRAIVSALGKARGSQSTKLVIKLDAWHAISLPLLRAAFPDTPWIFLFRDPVEVIVSHLQQPGQHTVPGLMSLNGPFGSDDSLQSREVQIAKAIGAISAAAVEHWPLGGGIAVNYTSLRNGGIDRIMNHFGMEPNDEARQSLAVVAGFDAKSPDRQFVSDSSTKAAMASAETRDAARAHLAKSHEKLTALSEMSR